MSNWIANTLRIIAYRIACKVTVIMDNVTTYLGVWDIWDTPTSFSHKVKHSLRHFRNVGRNWPSFVIMVNVFAIGWIATNFDSFLYGFGTVFIFYMENIARPVANFVSGSVGNIIATFAAAGGMVVTVRPDPSRTPYGKCPFDYAFDKAFEALRGGITGNPHDVVIRIADPLPIDKPDSFASHSFEGASVAGTKAPTSIEQATTRREFPLNANTRKALNALPAYCDPLTMIESDRSRLDYGNDNVDADNVDADNVDAVHTFTVTLKNSKTGKFRFMESRHYSTNENRALGAMEVASAVYNTTQRITGDSTAGRDWIVMLNATPKPKGGFDSEFEIDADLLDLHKAGVDVTPILDLDALIG